MKIIFLDMDGVLCTKRSHVGQGCLAPNGIMHTLDREAVGLVNVLALGVIGEDIQFVLISTWRLPQHPIGRGGKESVERHLREFGWCGTFHDDWRTPSLGSEEMRGQEIANWLDEHPEITDYLIIDDGIHFDEAQRQRQVRTNYNDGLSWADFKRATKLLHPNVVCNW